MNQITGKMIGIIKSPKILMAAGIAGMVLILLSSFFPAKKTTKQTAPAESLSAEEYRVRLEEGIRQTVQCITGSDQVNVVITLESGIRYTYADVNEGTAASRVESNAESTSSERKQSYITVRTADGGEQALLVTAEMPAVRGVAIVCEGGDDENLNEKITNAVTAALNITSKRVYVTGGR